MVKDIGDLTKEHIRDVIEIAGLGTERINEKFNLKEKRENYVELVNELGEGLSINSDGIFYTPLSKKKTRHPKSPIIIKYLRALGYG